MTTKKRLLLVASDPVNNVGIHSAIDSIIGEQVETESRSVTDIPLTYPCPDLILLSGLFLHPAVSHRFPGVPILIPKRVFSGHCLEEVLLLPRGYNVLFVSNNEESCFSLIEDIRNLGLDHVEYIPYWGDGNIDLTKIDTAITISMSHIVPAKISQIIDLGLRILSIDAFNQLLLALNLDHRFLEKYNDYYSQVLIKPSWRLAETLKRLESKHEQEKKLINEFTDGILIINSQGVVERANHSSTEILGLSHNKIVRQPYAKVLENTEKISDLLIENEKNHKSTSIHLINDKKIIVTKIKIQKGSYPSNIIILSEVEHYQNIQSKVQMKLAESGFVAKYDFNDIITASPILRKVKETAFSFGKTGKNILITGESGTGKELFAHAIHVNSPQHKGPFVPVNFACISDNLMESELFGYAEGAFTGAKPGGNRGCFEHAHGGTLFMDEIGEASHSLQTKLLRVLQEKEIRRIAGGRVIPIKVRIISSTNVDLQNAIEQDLFRNDLYYRLNTLNIHILPLRERKEDVLLILNAYLKNNYKITKRFSATAQEFLHDYSWPGNIRELLNVAEHICVICEGRKHIELEDFPPYMFSSRRCTMKNFEDSGTNDFKKTIDELSSLRITTELVRECLRYLRQNNDKAIGRKSLVSILTKRGLQVTEGYMRRAVAEMNRMGLVHVGSTRQGTGITNRGLAFLQYIDT